MQQRQGLVRAGIFMLFLRIHRVASRSCTSAFVTSSASRLSVGSEAPSRRSFWSNSGNRSPPTSQRRGDILRRYASDQPDDTFFAEELDFASMGVQSTVLLGRLERMGLQRPTAVQSAAFKAIREEDSGDLTIGAETGSGKTLAYLLPLIDEILERKRRAFEESGASIDIGYDYARALILVPNKELTQQVVRMAVPLAGGPSSLIFGGSTLTDPNALGKGQDGEVLPSDQVRLAIFPGGLDDPMGFPPFRKTRALGGKDPAVDLVIATPAALGPLGLKPKFVDLFEDIDTIVVDEADMLLDGGYIRQLENVLLGFKRAGRLNADFGDSKRTQHIFVGATLPNYGTRSVDAYLQRRFPYSTSITMGGMHQARHSGLADQTLWMSEQSKQERMKSLAKLLDQPASEGGLQGEKVMVFLNSVDDVEGAGQALQRAGHNALTYHAKMPLDERTTTLDSFRRYDKTVDDEDTIPVLVCTDLAARGLDVPNVDVVVQLQFAGNVVAHLHRMGRCGRAGLKKGRGIVFYDDETEGTLVQVIRDAEAKQESMVLEGNDVLDLDDEGDEVTAGSVKKAFSRKRGFSKKRKKLRKETEQH